jgi:hypothetical protein
MYFAAVFVAMRRKVKYASEMPIFKIASLVVVNIVKRMRLAQKQVLPQQQTIG